MKLREFLSDYWGLVIVFLVAFLAVGTFCFYMFAYPLISVWQQGLLGEAELKRAEWNRQIVVREAQAKKDAAELLNEAEISRARGVAAANKIIGDSLQNNEAYLRYLWIQNLENSKGQVIYIPTEAGLPILEAGKRN